MSEKSTDNTPLEVGALTEWDALSEVIVGGYEAHWPVLTPTELNFFRASHSPEVQEIFERTQGTSMEESQPDMFERVKKEVGDLVATFEGLGVTVYQPRPSTPDDIALYGTDSGLVPWFPRDMFITHKNKIIFASLGLPMLQKSQQLFYEIMDAKAKSSDITEIIGVPFPNFAVKDGAKVNNNVPLVDGGDVLFFGDHLFVGVSQQKNMGSNERGAAWLKTVLGPDYTVITCPLHEKFFHLDLVMSAPRQGLVMLAPDAFVKGVPAYFDDWDKIEVTGEQAMHGCLNGLPVDSENYVLGINVRDDMNWLIAEIEERGIKVHPVWFDEHNQRDGSIRCATQQLLRVPGE